MSDQKQTTERNINMLITDLHGHVTVCECVVRVERLEQLIIFLERPQTAGSSCDHSDKITQGNKKHGKLSRAAMLFFSF